MVQCNLHNDIFDRENAPSIDNPPLLCPRGTRIHISEETVWKLVRIKIEVIIYVFILGYAEMKDLHRHVVMVTNSNV